MTNDLRNDPNGKSSHCAASASSRQVGGNHYKDAGIAPWDVVDTWPIAQRIGYYRGSTLKYLMRMGAKDASIQEIRKGIHCAEKLLEVLIEAETLSDKPF